MKPFTLHTVLEHRKRQESIAQNRLFEARKIRQIVAAKLETEMQNRHAIIAEAEIEKQEGIEIVALIRIEDKINAIGENIKAIRKNLEEKDKIIESEHANLLMCAKERKVMERLKEEQNRNWQDYLNKKEAAMLDEIAIIRHGPENR